MYAIIQSGGHQIRVTKGATAIVAGTVGEPGDAVTLEQVLLVEKDGGEILAGAPFVANARITAVVDGEKRGPKIRVFKKKRRKGMRRTKGHRAVYTQVRITDILV
jgi:large subunit ribosomal protein L21